MHSPSTVDELHEPGERELWLYSMPAGAGTTRYFVEARPPSGGRVRLVAPDGLVVASWRPQDDGLVRGQWISPIPELVAVIDQPGYEVCRAAAEPAGPEHESSCA